MKSAVFVLVCLFLTSRTHAQTQTKSTLQPKEPILKVLLTKSGMTVTYLNKPLPIQNVQQLDSLVRTIPDPTHSKIEFEGRNADRDLSITIIRTLEKCNCDLATKSIAIAN